MFGEFILAIGEMFDKEISDVLRQLYWNSLEPFTDEQCKKAFNEIILSSRFFPKPVDIIEAIRGTQGNRATEAWIQTLNAIRRIGTYQSVKFDDPVIHAVIEHMGGWPEMGNMLVDEEKWKQKEFERLYPIMEARGNLPDYLPGREEISNTSKGYIEHITPPIMIGGKECLRIEDSKNSKKG